MSAAIVPSDAAVAARSFPRRWRALFARAAGDDEHQDVLARSGADGLARQAAKVLTDTFRRLPPTSVAIDTALRPPLDQLDAAAEALAAAIDHVPADQWAGEPIQALTSGIDEAAALLRRAERAIDAALSA